ncbi:hypothetical protein CUJ83_01225 [Methanocella sp. CWC-04]|uniref:Lipoprotein n=1 Tax=Methanooceanicella nereidis TaxID=2052831 RepID=A0AAP2RAK0_9EURY|nr:hypothetical protein [Methanocella sp. CWC-04]MCD1293619.1 hypothetical protein [Methanocella sp. CWC-04]
MKDVSMHRLLLVSLITAGILLSSCCIGQDIKQSINEKTGIGMSDPSTGNIKPAISTLEPGKFIFLEHTIMSRKCSDSSGYDGKIERTPIMAEYSYDRAANMLKVPFSTGATGNLKVILGEKQDDIYAVYPGQTRSSHTGNLEYVYDLPCSCKGIKVENIGADGTAYIEYNGKYITLRPGEEWTDTKTYDDPLNGAGGMTVKQCIDDRIVNHGIMDGSCVVAERSWPAPMTDMFGIYG